ncbi:transposase [Streptacidiphilus sp. PB12-B1b]|nr:transposase [Streptacidiphilus sp. PB12-B1b]
MVRAAWLVSAHHLPVRRAASVLSALLGAPVSAGWAAALRGKAARLVERDFLRRVKELITAAPVAHADETCARAADALRYLHVPCSEYLTAMRVGDRTKECMARAGSGLTSTASWSATATRATCTWTRSDTPGAALISCVIFAVSTTGTPSDSCGPRRWPPPCWRPRTPPGQPPPEAWTRWSRRTVEDPQRLPRRAGPWP